MKIHTTVFWVIHYRTLWATIPRSVQSLTRGWTVREMNPSEGQIFHAHPDWPWGPPSLLHNGYHISFPWLKRPGCGVNHPHPSCAKVKDLIYTTTLPLGPHGLFFASTFYILHYGIPIIHKYSQEVTKFLLNQNKNKGASYFLQNAIQTCSRSF